MRIYVDFDDVVTETARTLCGYAAEMFGRHVAYRDVFAFDLRLSFSLDDAQIARLMARAHSPAALAEYPETPGATATIAAWKAAGHEIEIVTGRPPSTHDGTVAWLARRGLGDLPVIHVDKFGRDLGGMFHSRNYVMSLDDLLALRYDFAVEDSPIGLGHLARMDVGRVAVFSRPWNRETPLPDERFRRRATWRGVAALLRTRPARAR